jgi:hypothetical protein
LKEAGSSAGDHRGVGGSSRFRELTQGLDVHRALVEVVVGDQAAIRLAAELTVLLLV